MNTGDWTENCTAIIEDKMGELMLIRWSELTQWLEEQNVQKASSAR